MIPSLAEQSLEDLIRLAITTARDAGYDVDHVKVDFDPLDDMEEAVAWFSAEGLDGDIPCDVHVPVGEEDTIRGYPTVRDAVIALIRAVVDTPADAPYGDN